MMISTKGRYALRVLIDMAEHQTEKFINEYLDPVIDANKEYLGVEASVNV